MSWSFGQSPEMAKRKASATVRGAPAVIVPKLADPSWMVTFASSEVSVAVTASADDTPVFLAVTSSSMVSLASALALPFPMLRPAPSSSTAHVSTCTWASGAAVTLTVASYGRWFAAVTVTVSVPVECGTNGSVTWPVGPVSP